MPTYVEYKLEDGSTVLIETEEPAGGVVKAARGPDDVARIQAQKKFEEALQGIKPWVKALRQQLNDLVADEVEVTFGIKTVGEVGVFAVGKLGAEANYEVTLKWGNK
jgi:hypothetical protein